MNFNAKRLCYVNNRLQFTYITYLFYFYLLADEGSRKTSKTKLFAENVANQGLFYPLTVPIINNALFEKRNALLSTEISKSICYSGRV